MRTTGFRQPVVGKASQFSGLAVHQRVWPLLAFRWTPLALQATDERRCASRIDPHRPVGASRQRRFRCQT